MAKKRKDFSKDLNPSANFSSAFAGLGGLIARNQAKVSSAEEDTRNQQAEKLPLKKNKKIKLHLQKERAGRKGKTVIVIKGFPEDTDFGANTFQKLIKNIKKSLACSVQIEEHNLVVQGDLKDRLKKLLEKLDYQVR